MVTEAAVRQGVAQGWVPWSTGDAYRRLRDEARDRLGREPEPYDVLEQAILELLQVDSHYSDLGWAEAEISRWLALSAVPGPGATSGSPEREELRSEIDRLLQEQEHAGDNRSEQRMARIRLLLAQEAVLDAMPRVHESLRARLPELYAHLDAARRDTSDGSRPARPMLFIARIAQAMLAILLASQPPAEQPPRHCSCCGS